MVWYYLMRARLLGVQLQTKKDALAEQRKDIPESLQL